MKQFLPLISTVLLLGSNSLLLLSSNPVLAQSAQFLDLKTVQTRQEAIPVAVYEGYGMNISFLNTDEVIIFATLDNPATYSLILDGSPCQGEDCPSQLIHLRLLKDIEFPHLTTSKNNHTFLSVKTRDLQQNTHLYVFRLMPQKGEPKYHTLSLTSSQPTQNTPTMGNQIDIAHVLEGIVLAKAEERLPDNPELWQRITLFINYVKQGFPYVEATQKAGVSLSLIHKLEVWGRGLTQYCSVKKNYRCR